MSQVNNSDSDQKFLDKVLRDHLEVTDQTSIWQDLAEVTDFELDIHEAFIIRMVQVATKQGFTLTAELAQKMLDKIKAAREERRRPRMSFE